MCIRDSLCEYHTIDLCWSSNFEFNIKLERSKYYGENKT